MGAETGAPGGHGAQRATGRPLGTTTMTLGSRQSQGKEVGWGRREGVGRAARGAVPQPASSHCSSHLGLPGLFPRELLSVVAPALLLSPWSPAELAWFLTSRPQRAAAALRQARSLRALCSHWELAGMLGARLGGFGIR